MNKIRILLTVFVASLILFPAVVIAQTDEEESSTEPTTSQEDKDAIKAAKKAEIEARRAEFENKLDERRSEALKNKCEAAQNRLEAALKNADAIYNNRQSRYTEVIDKLNNLLTRISESTDLDTSAMVAHVATLDDMVTEFFADFDMYVAALEDAMNATDCSTDPTEFHENLELAKSLRATLREKTTAIKTFFDDTIKPGLRELKAQIESDDDSDDSEESEEGSE